MEFLKSAATKQDYINDQKPEICLIGRSNVGKSSIINALANKKIAFVSATPGRTQLVNFYDCGKFRLVDLPGYGYARLSKDKQQALVYVVEDYLFNANNLKAICQVIDASVITDLDIEMSNYFNHLNPVHYVIINKIDKVRNDFKFQLKTIAKQLKVNEQNVICISALKKTNLNILKTLLNKIAG